MSAFARPVIVIPARMAATRLPGKPLRLIHGRPMILHVLDRVREADLGPAIVACAETEIAEIVTEDGGIAVLTDPDLPSGSDRIRAALCARDPDKRFDAVINVQGDLPTIEAAAIRAALDTLADGADMSTLVADIADPGERNDPNVVKAAVAFAAERPAPGDRGRALYFSRQAIPSGDGPLFHHIGLYGFTRAALETFTSLPPAAIERRERLEQLRALAAGMRIDAALVDTVPLGVDTSADLDRAARLLSPSRTA